MFINLKTVEEEKVEKDKILKRNINFTQLIPGRYRLSVSIRQCSQLTAAGCTPWSIRLRTFRWMRSNKLSRQTFAEWSHDKWKRRKRGGEPSEAIFSSYGFCINKHVRWRVKSCTKSTVTFSWILLFPFLFPFLYYTYIHIYLYIHLYIYAYEINDGGSCWAQSDRKLFIMFECITTADVVNLISLAVTKLLSFSASNN